MCYDVIIFYLISKIEPHLHALFYINKKDIMNTKEYQKIYYENNREKIEQKRLETHKANPEKRQKQQMNFYDKNSDRLIERQKIYNRENAERIKKYQQEYYKKNKVRVEKKRLKYRTENADKIKERTKIRVVCECGCETIKIGLKRHQRTPKHKKLMEEKRLAEEKHLKEAECIVIKKPKKKRKRLVIIDKID